MVYEDPTNQQANQKLVGNDPSISGSAPTQNPATAPIQKFNQANQVRQQSDVDPNQQRQGSGAFTNIRKYLDVNRGAAQKLGEKVQSKIGQQASDIRAGIEKSQEQFKTGVSQVADVSDAGEVSQLKGASDIKNKLSMKPIDPYSKIYGGSEINPVDYYKQYVSSDKTDDFSKQYEDILNRQGVFRLIANKERNDAERAAFRKKQQDDINKLFTDYGLDINKIPRSGAEQLISNPELLSQFRNLQEGKTVIPQQTLTGTELKPVEAMAKATQSELGRMGLLKSSIQSPTQSYTSGQQSLDQLFLQAAPKVGDELQRYASGQFRGIQQALNPAMEQQEKLRSQIEQARTKAQEDIASTLGKVELDETGKLKDGATGEIGSLYSDIYKERKRIEDKQRSDVDTAKKMLEQGQLTDETARLLGLDPGSNIYNINVADYANMISPGDVNVTMADVMDENQMNRLNALSKLANQNIDLGIKEGSTGPQFSNAKDLQSLLQTKQKELDALNQQIGSGWYSGPIYKDQYGINVDVAGAANEFNRIKNDPSATTEDKQNAFNNYINSAKQAQYDATVLAQRNNQLFGRVEQEQYYNNLVNLLNQYGEYNPFRLIGDTKPSNIDLNEFRGVE